MELLVIIAIAIVVATAACAAVEAMAQERGRDARMWTIAALIGLLVALVGYLVVVAALLILGPSHDHGRRSRRRPHACRTHRTPSG
jgi:amino acid transporter